jgi:hypothetical protein
MKYSNEYKATSHKKMWSNEYRKMEKNLIIENEKKLQILRHNILSILNTPVSIGVK